MKTSKCMGLVWYSCTDYLPKGKYNPHLIITDGRDVFHAVWRDVAGWKRFDTGNWYIEPERNSDGYWWADIIQTVSKFDFSQGVKG